MEFKYQIKQLLILLNQFFVVSFLCYEYLHNIDTEPSSIMALSIISVMIIGASYIEFSNLKLNYVLSEYSNLLVFISWVFLLFRSNDELFISLSFVLYIFLPYKIITFLLMFIFQGCTYTNKKQIHIIFKITCLITLASIIKLSPKIFSIMFSLQLFLNCSCFIYVLYKNKNRVAFIFKQERKNLLFSVITIIVPYIVYIFFFLKDSQYMDNTGLYIITALPLLSVYKIVKSNSENYKKPLIFNSNVNILSIIFLIFFINILGILLNFNVIGYFLLIHCIILFFLIYLTLLYSEIKQTILDKNKKYFETIQKNFYINGMYQSLREEEIKKDFSNYLHDEILQDLLSIKNLMLKVHKPEVKEIIIKTLDNLNSSIRDEMQEYHPVILKSITMKENLMNLIDTIKEAYYRKNITTSFTCNDDLFLVQPYDLIIYRIIRELVKNSFKHSKCNNIWILLSQKKESIKLVVEDDGIGLKNIKEIDTKIHKGLNSIQEQIQLLGGNFDITSKNSTGLRITIEMNMKGDSSYEYFINR